MHDLRHVLLRDIHSKVRPLKWLKLLVDARDAADLSLARTRVHALAVAHLAVLERGRDVDTEEVRAGARLLEDRVLDRVARGLRVDGWGKDDCRTGAR